MADVAELHQEARELPVRQHNENISQQFAMASTTTSSALPQTAGSTSSNTSPKIHSATPATIRQLAASTKM